MNGTTRTDSTKEKLVNDFRTVVANAEELLRATASQTGDKVAAVRARVEESLAAGKRQLADVERNVVDKTKAAARDADNIVRQNPWQSIGIATAVGFLIGILTSRRD